MRCVICLEASADARRRVCGCSARVCHRCLMELLDRGRDNCPVCGSRFRSSAIARACRLALKNVDNDHDRARGYLKLAIAYSNAGWPRRSLRALAKAKHYAAPGSNLAHFIQLDSASNLLDTGDIAEAERRIMSVVHAILEMTNPITSSSAVLYAGCCTLLCKSDIKLDRLASAKSWLRRAMAAQGDLGLESQLAESLQIEAKLLRCEGKLGESKVSLQRAEGIMLRCEPDFCSNCKLQLDIAITEAELGEYHLARARLSGVLPKLRKRKNDRCAGLLPIAAEALSHMVKPARRLRRKTWPENVEFCVES